MKIHTPFSAFSASRRPAVLPVLGVVAVLALTGCGGDAADDAAASSDGASQAEGRDSDGRGQPGPGGAGFPGAQGKVAAVSDDVAQVQGRDSQTAVSFADATISTEKSAAFSDVAKGDCVTISFARSDSNDSGDSGSADQVAASVRISEPVDGECSAFGGPGGGPGGQPPEGAPSDWPSGAPTDLPSGAPTDLPSGAPDGQGRPGGPGGPGGRTSGKVTAVKDGAITVEATVMPAPGSTEEANRTESRTVAVGPDTTWTRTVPGTRSDVSEGRCVVAMGESDDTGALTARSVQVSDPVDGECSSFGGPGGGRGGQQDGRSQQEGAS